MKYFKITPNKFNIFKEITNEELIREIRCNRHHLRMLQDTHQIEKQDEVYINMCIDGFTTHKGLDFPDFGMMIKWEHFTEFLDDLYKEEKEVNDNLLDPAMEVIETEPKGFYTFDEMMDVISKFHPNKTEVEISLYLESTLNFYYNGNFGDVIEHYLPDHNNYSKWSLNYNHHIPFKDKLKEKFDLSKITNDKYQFIRKEVRGYYKSNRRKIFTLKEIANALMHSELMAYEEGNNKDWDYCDLYTTERINILCIFFTVKYFS